MTPLRAGLLAVASLAALGASILHGCGEPQMNEPPLAERGKGPSAGTLPAGTAQSVIEENK